VPLSEKDVDALKIIIGIVDRFQNEFETDLLQKTPKRSGTFIFTMQHITTAIPFRIKNVMHPGYQQ
jgi:hypothetical protein